VENYRYIIKQTVILIFVWLTIPTVLLGQEVLFNKTFDNVDYLNFSRSTISTIDGGFISIGENSKTGNDSLWLIKLDEFGCLEWEKTFYPFTNIISSELSGRNIIQYQDSSYLVDIVYLNTNLPDENLDISLTKFSKDGEILWSQFYGWDDRVEISQDLLTLPDGGAVFVGSTAESVSTIDYLHLGFVIRVDEQGDELWSYVHDGRSIFTKVLLNEEGNLVVAGSGVLESDSSSILLEFDLEGNIQKNKLVYPKTEEMYANGTTGLIQSKMNTDYIGTGYHTYEFGNSSAAFIYRVDENFELEWIYWYNIQVGLKRPRDVIELDNGDLIIGGIKPSIAPDLQTVGWLARFTADGELLWEQNYTAPDDDDFPQFRHEFYGLEKVEDNTILATGWTYQDTPNSNISNPQIWIAKIDADGNTSIPLEASISSTVDELCLQETSEISLEIMSTTGCYETEWTGNGAAFLSQNTKDDYSFLAEEVGVYELIANTTDETGNSISNVLTIEVYSPLIFPESDTIMIEESLDLGEIPYFDSTEWFGSGAPYLTEENGRLFFEGAPLGQYVVILNSDCLGQQAIAVIVDSETSTSTVNNFEIKVYPNPATTSLTFVYDIDKRETLFVYNSLGQLVKELEIIPTANSQNINTSNFVDGVYYWQMGDEFGKVVVQP